MVFLKKREIFLGGSVFVFLAALGGPLFSSESCRAASTSDAVTAHSAGRLYVQRSSQRGPRIFELVCARDVDDCTVTRQGNAATEVSRTVKWSEARGLFEEFARPGYLKQPEADWGADSDQFWYRWQVDYGDFHLKAGTTALHLSDADAHAEVLLAALASLAEPLR